VYRQRLAALRNVIARTRTGAMPKEVEGNVPKKEPVLCGWCSTEALPEVRVAGYPVCEMHQREITAELQVNAGRAVTPTKADRETRREGFRRLMEADATWQQSQRWAGRG
jgi:hypothetical protein